MNPSFRPKAYLLTGCPFCLKFLMFMSEARLADDIELVKMDPKDANFEQVKTKLGTALQAKPTFPTVEVEPGIYKVDSDQLIGYFAAKHAIDVSTLPALSMFKEGVFPTFIKLYKENAELKKSAGH